MPERSTEELLELCANLEALKESWEALDVFSTRAVKIIEKYHGHAWKEIKVELNDVHKTTGYDWSCYLNDLGFDDLAEGDFYDRIKLHLIGEIAKESAKFELSNA